VGQTRHIWIIEAAILGRETKRKNMVIFGYVEDVQEKFIESNMKIKDRRPSLNSKK
jgi:hypothetical protein